MNAGAVNVIYGTANGLTATGNQLWEQNSPGIFGDAEAEDQFGSALAAADFNGDGVGDLAIGTPMESFMANAAGVVHVLYGSSTGLRAAGSSFFSQNHSDIFGDAEDYDTFSAALAAADFNGTASVTSPSVRPSRT